MTPEERAHKIWLDYLDDEGRPKWTMIELRNHIASEIRAAEQEIDNHYSGRVSEIQAAAKAEAYEDAAKIADYMNTWEDEPVGKKIADAIRARAREVAGNPGNPGDLKDDPESREVGK